MKDSEHRSECWQRAVFLAAAILTFAWIAGWMIYGMTQEAVQAGQNLHR